MILYFPVLTACASGITDPDLEEVKNDDITCVSQPEEGALRPYYEFLKNNDKVVEAAGFCELPAELQEKVWDTILEAEETGLPPTAQVPSSFYVRPEAGHKKTKVPLTKEEAHEIYAAHLAHSLWLEKNEIVPWSIVEYSPEQLEELLKPEAWFNTWDDTNEAYDFHLILDHSPREAYLIASGMAPSVSDQRTALNDIIKATRSYKHGSVTHDTLEIVTIKTMEKNKKSFYGCLTMSPFVVQLANALNIPGRTIWDYYADSSEGHRSAFFEPTDQVLAHGDDPYDSWLGNTPSPELLDNYEFWKANVISYPEGNSQSEHNSRVHNFRNTMKYPAQRVLKEYCDVITGDYGSGREFLDLVFLDDPKGAFATLEEVNDFEKRILNITNDCIVFPENNPDNK